jgi:DNA polymerase-3 subunit epsilon
MKPTFSNLAPEIAKFLKDCDLAGYNSINSNVPMLKEEFLRAGIEFPLTGKKLIDVQIYSQDGTPKFRSCLKILLQ